MPSPIIMQTRNLQWLLRYPRPLSHMTQIGILADTHGYLDAAILNSLTPCDEIWHAGDFGNVRVVENLQALKPLRGVWGNVDDATLRATVPEINFFYCEDVPVLMTHIGGYPGKYAPAVTQLLSTHRPKLFICGHSHILKIMYDDRWSCLHINPGACGRQGWHVQRTLVRLSIDGQAMRGCEVVTLGPRALPAKI